jgi:hypothetical protein
VPERAQIEKLINDEDRPMFQDEYEAAIMRGED